MSFSSLIHGLFRSNNFHLFWDFKKNFFIYNSIVVREHTLQDVSLSQFVEPYFIAQHLFYLGACSMHISKNVYSAEGEGGVCDCLLLPLMLYLLWYFQECCITHTIEVLSENKSSVLNQWNVLAKKVMVFLIGTVIWISESFLLKWGLENLIVWTDMVSFPYRLIFFSSKIFEQKYFVSS